MLQKHLKLNVIIHAFRISRGPSSESHEMPPRDMQGHWKWVMWLETNIWMCLHLFWGNFGFHKIKMKKWGVQRLFETMQMMSSTRATSQVTSTFLSMFREKIWPVPHKSKNVTKTTKIEGYSNFPESRVPNATRCLLGSWEVIGKRVMWLGTNIWMSLRSFRDNFVFHEKWTNGGVQRLFKAMQMVPSTHTMLQVTSALS